MEYEWDDKKNKINLAKHCVDFTAATDFDWSTAIEMEETRSDYGEERFIASGYIGNRLHILV